MISDRIIIVGGGASLREYDVVKDLTRYGHVLAIKDSMLYASCHEGLNMDRLWIENRQQQLKDLEFPVWQRKGIVKNYPWPEEYTFDNDFTTNRLSDRDRTLNGSNSGMCALNLAYQRSYAEVFLLGFDFGKTDGTPYWYPFYDYHPTKKFSDSKYKAWGSEFDVAAEQCLNRGMNVYNVNPRDSIPALKQITFKEFIKCL